MAEERPAFTVEAPPQRTAELPLLTWIFANAGIGVVAGAFIRATDCIGLGVTGMDPPFCRVEPASTVVAIAAAAAVGGTFLLALPIRRGGDGGVRAAAAGAWVAAAAALFLFSPFAPPAALPWGFALLGLAAPCAMLTAIRPDAALTPRKRDERGPQRWLRVGAFPAGALIGGLGLAWAFQEVAVGGGMLLALAGAVLIARGRVPRPTTSAPAPAERRFELLVRMTPMLRHATAADVGLGVCMAACLGALTRAAWLPTDWHTMGYAAAIGGLVGALLWRLWAARVDARAGRGAVLTMGCASGALAPLVLLGAFPGPQPFVILVAAMLCAFALSSGPQRHALLFDLASSRSRPRAALDGQALKLFAAGAGVLLSFAVEAAAPGLGLPVASAVGLAALAAFAPTLGSLGRRAH